MGQGTRGRGDEDGQGSRTRVPCGGTLEAAGQVIEARLPDKLIKSKQVLRAPTHGPDGYGYSVHLEWEVAY